jgi:hypothetical protein
VSTEIVKHQAAAPAQRGGALSLGQMTPHDAWKFAEALAGARLLPQEYQNNPGSVLWAMEYGRALGLDVVTTITTIHVIKGKPTQSADLMLSRAREAGHRVRIKSERERCVVSIVRHDDPEDENVVEWTLADARTAGLFPGKSDSNWAKYPRAMLRARAIAECVRIACPEVLHGAIYTAEEMGARVDDAGLPVDAEVQQLRRVEPGQTDQWTTAAPEAPAAQWVEDAVRITTDAEKATDPAVIRGLYREANGAGLLTATVLAKLGGQEQSMELGAFLVARGQELAVPAPTGNEKPGDDGVTDVEVVAEGETEADIAERELRAAAEKVGLDNLDEEFSRSYGIPIEQAPASQLRAMTAILTGSAA